jgi:signal transduction histidine kinase
MRYEMGAVSVADVVRDASELMEEQLVSSELRLERLPPIDGLTVRADVDRLRQILVNLLANAAMFTDRGGTVTLSCAADPEHVSLEVRDTGIGIASDQLDAVFEPFVQISDARAPRRGGTGLGLAISRALARDMGGDLTVQSAPGRGSTFRVRLQRA